MFLKCRIVHRVILAGGAIVPLQPFFDALGAVPSVVGDSQAFAAPCNEVLHALGLNAQRGSNFGVRAPQGEQAECVHLAIGQRLCLGGGHIQCSFYFAGVEQGEVTLAFLLIAGLLDACLFADGVAGGMHISKGHAKISTNFLICAAIGQSGQKPDFPVSEWFHLLHVSRKRRGCQLETYGKLLPKLSQ